MKPQVSMSFTRQGKLKRRYKYGLAIIVTFFMLSAALYFIQESLIFRPTVLDQDYQYTFNSKFEEVFLDTSEDSRINAIHFKTDNPKGVILYLHGNMGDLSRWGLIAEDMLDYGYDVFAIDYRTYGKSTGRLSEKALLTDTQYAYDFLRENYNENEIIIYGRSLGTGMATYVASQNSPKHLILETPYSSLLNIARHRFPLFPVKPLLKYKLHSDKYIKNVNCPISIIHGTDDGVIPLSSAKSLFKAAQGKKIDMKVIEGGSHNDLSEFENYKTWLEKILGDDR